MILQSLAIVGKNNEPLFMKEYSNDETSNHDLPEAELFGLTISTKGGTVDGLTSKGKEISLKQQFILHAALDRLEELDGPPPGFGWRVPSVTGHDAMWIGLLGLVEEMRIYGYMTTTKVKILMVLFEQSLTGMEESSSAASSSNNTRQQEADIKSLMIEIHRLYVEYTLNPFNRLGDLPIVSTKFEDGVASCVDKFNRTI